MQEFKVKIGHWMKRKRECAGLSTKDAAQALGLKDSRVVEGYENGTISIPLKHLGHLVIEYKASPSELNNLLFHIRLQSPEGPTGK
jgi:transcriptional regulator with XRE-family HTH domain